MCSRNKRQAVVVVECLRDILTKGVPCASRTDTPTTSVIWIAPEEITHGSFVGDFLYSVETPDVIEGVDAWGEATMEAEDLVVDEGSEGEVIEEVGEILPDVGVAVLAEAFVVEAVDLGDLAGFVVAAEDGDARWVADFEGDEEGDGFDGVVAAVYVVA